MNGNYPKSFKTPQRKETTPKCETKRRSSLKGGGNSSGILVAALARALRDRSATAPRRKCVLGQEHHERVGSLGKITDDPRQVMWSREKNLRRSLFWCHYHYERRQRNAVVSGVRGLCSPSLLGRQWEPRERAFLRAIHRHRDKKCSGRNGNIKRRSESLGSAGGQCIHGRKEVYHDESSAGGLSHLYKNHPARYRDGDYERDDSR